jgi:hypothetical protein
MPSEQAMRLAREILKMHCCQTDEPQTLQEPCNDADCGDYWIVSVAKALDAARREALEEAASVADKWAYTVVSQQIAKQIRTLIAREREGKS